MTNPATAHDPFIHFEQLNHPNTIAHATQQHAHTLNWAKAQPEFTALKQDIQSTLQDERQIPFCQEHRARMYHFYQNDTFPKGIYRVCSATSYRAGLPDWETLFSVADFDEILGADVYLDGVSHYVEAPNRVLLTLSLGGSDTAFTVEFDLAERTIIPSGFHFPAGKNHIAWRDLNSVWVCPAWDERQLTDSGYPRQVWLWQRGQSFSEATPILEIPSNGMMVNAWRYLDPQGAPIDLIEAADSFYSKRYYQVNEHNEALPLTLPHDAEISGYLAGHLLVKLTSTWQRANQSYPAGSLVMVKLNKGILGAAQLLFTPEKHQALHTVETTKRFVVATILDNVKGRLKVWRFSDGLWQEVDLPPLPSTLSEGAIDITDQPWGGDIVYLTADHFLTPLTLFALDLYQMELSVLRRQPKQFPTEHLTVSQHHARSSDGTAIPYFHIGDTPSPTTPTIVYAYGGFAVPELPHYLGLIGKHWCAKGGAFVLANIRGGGEFGPAWHQAAQKNNKHLSVDDLLAVVSDLHQKGLASPASTALQGGSNGGLITAAAFTQAPQAIGALVAEVPLTDMLNYHHLLAGASWLDEYGNPEQPSEREYLAALSPYHQLNSQHTYPPALITGSLTDDRVHPAHALKFHAKLQELGQTAYLYMPSEGGHSGDTTQAQTAEELALVLTFLRHHLSNAQTHTAKQADTTT